MLSETKYLQFIVQNDSITWYARLGHIGAETLKTMARKDLVIWIPKITVEKETCKSCLPGKQARQLFPQETSYQLHTDWNSYMVTYVDPLHLPRLQETDISPSSSIFIIHVVYSLKRGGRCIWEIQKTKKSKRLLSKRQRRPSKISEKQRWWVYIYGIQLVLCSIWNSKTLNSFILSTTRWCGRKMKQNTYGDD